MHAISCDSLGKTYRSGPFSRQGVDALQGVSLDVAPGEVFGLLGPNGAGKTTLVKILLSLTRPTSGTAGILGARIPDVRTRERVGFLPENHRYPPSLTGEQLLRYFGALAGVSRAHLDARIPSLLERVGMSAWAGTRVRKYSKGMLQRIGLAQALVNEPEVVFLDEPTDGVDPVGRKEIRELLRGLKEKGTTVFLNSHLLSEVELLCDRVAILDRGRIVRTGTVEELTTSSTDYIIGFEGILPQPLMDEMRARVVPATVEGNVLRTRVAGAAQLNAVIDLLRANGVTITSVARQRTSLEESFMNLVGGTTAR
jgi:ABC-2 type transport system ATP-binding protein